MKLINIAITNSNQTKNDAYNYLWALSDHEMENYFPDNDGFWSTTTFEIYKNLSCAKSNIVFIGSSWIDVSQNWKCPICNRDKLSIARIGKSNKIIMDIVTHHDHSDDYIVRDQLISEKNLLIRRFEPILICSDCNVAEANAKSSLYLEKWFSFSPYEIGMFITSMKNSKPKINLNIAKCIYDSVIINIKKTINYTNNIPINNPNNFLINRDNNIMEGIKLLECKSGIDECYLAWAFPTRSRNHFYTTNNKPTQKKGILMPF